MGSAVSRERAAVSDADGDRHEDDDEASSYHPPHTPVLPNEDSAVGAEAVTARWR
jgi:hypothetical protein